MKVFRKFIELRAVVNRPYPIFMIIVLEAFGFVVDLGDGTIFKGDLFGFSVTARGREK